LKDIVEQEEKIYILEGKLSPEQMVVAFTKAEKESKELIEKAKEKAGWTNWISSSVSNIFGYGST